jgi:hypothetical protein
MVNPDQFRLAPAKIAPADRQNKLPYRPERLNLLHAGSWTFQLATQVLTGMPFDGF